MSIHPCIHIIHKFIDFLNFTRYFIPVFDLCRNEVTSSSAKIICTTRTFALSNIQHFSHDLSSSLSFSVSLWFLLDRKIEGMTISYLWGCIHLIYKHLYLDLRSFALGQSSSTMQCDTINDLESYMERKLLLKHLKMHC